MIKILGISGSPRKGATDFCVQQALEAAAALGDVETEFLPLRRYKIRPCIGCDRCVKEQTLCPVKDDMVDIFPRILEADGFVIATPVYVFNVSGQLQSFTSRWRCIRKAKPGALTNKVGGAIAVGGTRNGGQELAVSNIIHTFLARCMIVVSSTLGNYSGGLVWSNDGGAPGAASDEWGMTGVRGVGQRVAEVAKMVKFYQEAAREATS